MKFQWIVVDVYGDINSGITATFNEAIKALQDWFGDGEPDAQLHYSITFHL